MVKRRQFIRYGGTGLLTTMGTLWLSGLQRSQAQIEEPEEIENLESTEESVETAVPEVSEDLSVQWLGHTCFLFTGNGVRILVNPFRRLGCTAGYRFPEVEADVVLISSYLLDEGAADEVPGNPQVLYEPGDYELRGINFKGIQIPHDREGGRRFGNNIAWRWTQGDINILHLGGAAAPIELEQKILMGQPDVALIPVGGGIKAYNPQEAKQAMKILNPKMVIPMHYRTEAADEESCDIVSVDEFLQLNEGVKVNRIESDRLVILPSDLPNNGPEIQVLDHQMALAPLVEEEPTEEIVEESAEITEEAQEEITETVLPSSSPDSAPPEVPVEGGAR